MTGAGDGERAEGAPAGWGHRRRGAVLVALAAVFGACAGENLFTPQPTTGGEQGVQVDITAPAESFAAPLGDSVQITVNLSSGAGVDAVVFSGLSSASSATPGEVRFTEESVDLPAPADTTISNFLLATAGQPAEDVDLIVQATDLLGGVGADTVTIRVGS